MITLSNEEAYQIINYLADAGKEIREMAFQATDQQTRVRRFARSYNMKRTVTLLNKKLREHNENIDYNAAATELISMWDSTEKV